MSSVDSLSLAGKTAIVTGSGKENGIGAAIALALARNGARVAINYVSETTAPRAAKVAASIEAIAGKDSVVIIQQDVTTTEGTKKLVAEAIKAFGVDRIDILGECLTVSLS
jgi:NAD(P)-dependent dehydrogenase (short-subunit alcohol dehydrogenase family)